MPKSVKNSLLTTFVIVVTVITFGCSAPFVPAGKEEVYSPSSGSSFRPSKGLTQSNTGGSVTIAVEWIEAGDNSLAFNVDLNTHSVDLDQYDLKELAVLRDDAGNEYRPLSWDSAPGGHHRRGTLTFTLPGSVSQGETKYIEILIRDVAGIEERVLKWEL